MIPSLEIGHGNISCLAQAKQNRSHGDAHRANLRLQGWRERPFICARADFVQVALNRNKKRALSAPPAAASGARGLSSFQIASTRALATTTFQCSPFTSSGNPAPRGVGRKRTRLYDVGPGRMSRRNDPCEMERYPHRLGGTASPRRPPGRCWWPADKTTGSVMLV